MRIYPKKGGRSNVLAPISSFLMKNSMTKYLIHSLLRQYAFHYSHSPTFRRTIEKVALLQLFCLEDYSISKISWEQSLILRS